MRAAFVACENGQQSVFCCPLRAVPDFEKLQRRFKASLERARAELPVTKTEAFSFYEKPSLSARKKDRIARDIDQDEERLPEQRWPFMAPRTKVRQAKWSPGMSAKQVIDEHNRGLGWVPTASPTLAPVF